MEALMNRKYLVFSLILALCLLLLSGCSPSPTAVTVGGRKVDASEYAFYLSYNRISVGEASGTILYDEEDTAAAKAAALEQIVTNEVVRLKCEEFGLELTEEQRETLARNKEYLVESLGGTAAYLEYLNQSVLTDRAYDKLQENDYYAQLLYDHMKADSEAYFTDEALRRYFAEHYATAKYIYISLLDDDGQRLDKEVRDNLLETAISLQEQALLPDASFEALMTEHNQDLTMTTEGIVVGELESRSIEYLGTLFNLEENAVSSVITTSDGYYILKRCPVPASYYDEHQTDIFLAACDDRFGDSMEAWKTEYTVTVSKVVDKMDLTNLSEFVK